MVKKKEKSKAAKKKEGESSQAENNNTSVAVSIEGIDDLDDDIRSQLPSQEHCTWLLNVIQIHAKKMAKELLDDHNKTVIETLKKDIEDLKQENQQMKSEIGKLKWSRDGINNELAKKTTEIDHLKQELDFLNQKQRERSVRITGIVEEEDENLSKKITEIAKKKMGLKKFKETDIARIHRSGKKKTSRTRDIIMQFENLQTRQTFYGAKQKLQASSTKTVYINDDLTEFRQKLLYDARLLVKKKKLRGAWSQHGNIMVLPENTKPSAIYNYRDLRIKSGLDNFGDNTSDLMEQDDIDSVSASLTMSYC